MVRPLWNIISTQNDFFSCSTTGLSLVDDMATSPKVLRNGRSYRGYRLSKRMYLYYSSYGGKACIFWVCFRFWLACIKYQSGRKRDKGKLARIGARNRYYK